MCDFWCYFFGSQQFPPTLPKWELMTLMLTAVILEDGLNLKPCTHHLTSRTLYLEAAPFTISIKNIGITKARVRTIIPKLAYAYTYIVP